MTEAEWLKSDDLQAMLEYLKWANGAGYARLHKPSLMPSDRKLRLFACARWRAAPAYLHGDRMALLVPAAGEAMADGEPAPPAGPPPSYGGFKPLLPDAAEAALGMVAWCRPGRGESAAAAALLREVVGNPFRRFAWSRHHDASPSGHELQFLHEDWRTPDVLAIAQAAYAGRDFAALPILADALEDAGCTQEDLLRHLRGQERCHCCVGAGILSTTHPTTKIRCHWCLGSGYIPIRAPHALGCWALDTIVGKE